MVPHDGMQCYKSEEGISFQQYLHLDVKFVITFQINIFLVIPYTICL